MKTNGTVKHYLLKDTETGKYVVKSTTKCMEHYINSKIRKVSFGDGPVYRVIQKIDLE